MNCTIAIQQTMRRCIRVEFLFTAFYLLSAAYFLRDYIQWTSGHFILGAAAFPLLVNRVENKHTKFPYRYLVAAFLCLLLCYVLPVKTFLFFAIGFSVFFLWEHSGLRHGFGALVLLVLCSPVFDSMANVFSFPVRLQLSQVSGTLLSLVKEEVTVQGNMIFSGGKEFSVDAACMGLNMLTVSLVLGITVLHFFGKKLKKTIRWWELLLYLMVIVVLNMVCNLFRIMLLVHFALMPGTPAHDLAGLLCLLVYVFLPAVLLAERVMMRAGTGLVPGNGAPARFHLPWHLFLFIAVLLTAQHMAYFNTYREENISTKEAAGFKTSRPAPGIIKLEKSSVLIYIKRLRGFFDTEHNPMFCWKGSGFAFRNVEQKTISGTPVYTSRLVKGGQVMHSAWWYSNGQHHTNSQVHWRWNAARGAAPYSIVNVTTASADDLQKQIAAILEKNELKAFFHL